MGGRETTQADVQAPGHQGAVVLLVGSVPRRIVPKLRHWLLKNEQ